MKIIVREKQGRKFSLTIPTGLMLNRTTAFLLSGVLEMKGITLTRKQTMRMIQVIRACRRSCPDWKLIEVESGDGSYLEISL